ncbi:MAG TPA: hypothetical protein VH912_01765 [Streptosporangiaceae bacterium]|jgi:hypothetical protein
MTAIVSTPGRNAPAIRRSRSATTPGRIRMLTAAVAGLSVLFGWLIVQGVANERDGYRDIGHRAAPQVAGASDLSFALSDMDAQVAGLLLIGWEKNLGVGQHNALTIFEQRRQQVDADLQRAAPAAGDPAAQRSLRKVLDALGSYEAKAAQAIMLSDEGHHEVGKPSAEALGMYLSANRVLKTELLPAVTDLTKANSAALDRMYKAQRDHRRLTVAMTALAGLALLAALITLQVLLARLFHRRFNPLLVLATLGVGVLLIASLDMFATKAEHLRAAKEDAFDSVLALSRARAVGYEFNADHGRYLLDSGYRQYSDEDFLDKAQQIASLPDVTTLDRYPNALRQAMTDYSAPHHHAYVWSGYFGVEFGNITFPGERELAEQTMSDYVNYMYSDAHVRDLLRDATVRDAVQFSTSYAPPNGNYRFDQYDKSLAALINLNRSYFDKSVRAGEHGLALWGLLPWVAVIAVVGLAYAGVRPRLAEYR